MTDDLEPTTPREAAERWLDRRREDSAAATVDSYRRRLDQFLRWCESERSEPLLSMGQLSGRDLQNYWEYRSQSLNQNSLRNEFGTLTKWLEWCTAIEAVKPSLPERAKQLKPSLSKDERVREDALDRDRAQRILDDLERMEYATREHVMMLLLWRTGCRISGLQALDLEDFDPEQQSLRFRHRPDQGTPLKNQHNSERLIALADDTVDVLQSYINRRRQQTRDEYGREPLVSTQRGRASDSLVRKTTYQLTHPCEIGPCPHDKDPQTCEYREHGHESRCPSAMSPHAVRTGAISHMFELGIPVEVISERVDSSPENLRDHYDMSDPEERLEQRREHIEDL